VPPSIVIHTAARVAGRLPGLKRLPVMKLLMLGEVIVLARDHIERLTPQERRRLVVLIREGRGRRENLPSRDRDELEALIAKAEPRLFAAAAVDKLSPIPLPKRLLRGKR
jgi:hypothetical protein